MATRWIGLVAAVALLAGACGDDGGSSPATTAGRTADQIAADKAAAQAAVLTQSDLPTGWTGRPHKEVNDAALNAELAGCLNVPLALINRDKPTSVHADDFEDPSGRLEVDNTVGVEVTAAQANALLAIYQKPQMPDCLQKALTTRLEKSLSSTPTSAGGGARVGQVKVATLDFPTVGQSHVAYRVTIPVTVQGQTVEITIDAVTFVKGRAGTSLTFQGNGQAFPTAMEVELAKVVEGRMPAA
jgi:hypothetical protein